ncbi:MAG: extracellular solute-binding protein [Anaerolineales bacterium]
MKHRKLYTFLALTLAVTLVLSACGPAPAATAEPIEPTEAMEPTEAPTEGPPESMLEGDPNGQTITFWHAFSSGANLEGMTAVIDKFNAENEFGITVENISQGSQGDLETAVNGAITTGELPSLTMGFPNGLARWYGLGIISALNPYIDDPVYGVDPEVWASIFPGPLSSGTLADGTQVGIPVNQSAQVLFYNFTWAEELGFDGPPATSAEFKEQACAAAAANLADDNPDNDDAGYVIFNGASNVLPWIWAFGGTGLSADGSGYLLNDGASLQAALFLKDLVDSGCTLTTPSFPNPELANRLALFANSSTAGIPFQQAAFDDIGSTDVWGSVPVPGPDGTLVVNAFGQMAGIVTTNADSDLASWIFLKYLTSPQTQALWVSMTGYFPTQATTDLGSKPADDPIWAQSYALMEYGVAEPNLPAHGAVRGLINGAFDAAMAAADEAAIQAILDQLQADADEAVAETQ